MTEELKQAAQAGEREAFETTMRAKLGWDDLILTQDEDRYNDSRADLALDIWRLARASLPTQPAAQATPEPVLRFCPGCGSVGDVPDTFRDCCPDGAKARLIPASLAHSCHDLFKLAIGAAQQSATPEPVGELVDVWCALEHWRREPNDDGAVLSVTAAIRAYAHATRPAPGVPEDVQPNEMENKWCWWIGDDESFHTADTESEAHGEAQCRIDDDCEPGQTHLYSVARVQHPIDSIGMDWLAQHIADSIEEQSCEWCDDNTGAEEPSISLPVDDKKALGTMVAGFLRQRVGVEWWTADQRTVTVHTYVSGSNDAPALTAAQAKGGA